MTDSGGIRNPDPWLKLLQFLSQQNVDPLTQFCSGCRVPWAQEVLLGGSGDPQGRTRALPLGATRAPGQPDEPAGASRGTRRFGHGPAPPPACPQEGGLGLLFPTSESTA